MDALPKRIPIVSTKAHLYQNLLDIFSTAAEHIDTPPKLKLISNRGRKVEFNRADPAKADTKKYPGSEKSVFIYVDEAFAGVINGRNAKCYIQADVINMHPGFRDFLGRLNEDFARELTKLGREQTTCQFCHRLLTDARSMEAGYGPTCADRWGLPWGTQS